jgi:hypothetical protein
MALSCVSPLQVMSQLSTIKNKILKINSLEILTTAALTVHTVSVQARTTDNSPAIQDGSVCKSITPRSKNQSNYLLNRIFNDR